MMLCASRLRSQPFDRALATSFQIVLENCLSPRWGLSASLFGHGLRRGLHSYAALRLAEKLRRPAAGELLQIRANKTALRVSTFD
jgi:hypothetical protein